MFKSRNYNERGSIIATAVNMDYPAIRTIAVTPDKLQTDETCYDRLACDKLVVKEIRTLVPVSIKPTIIAQKPTVLCLGDVKVLSGTVKCNKPEKAFDFTIAQNISVKIPVQYKIQTCYRKECFEDMIALDDVAKD